MKMKYINSKNIYLTFFVIFLILFVGSFVFQIFSSKEYEYQIGSLNVEVNRLKQNLNDYSELAYGTVEITGPMKNGRYLLYSVQKDGSCFEKYSKYNSLTSDIYCKEMFGSAFMGGRGISSLDVKFINEELTYFDGSNWINVKDPSCAYAALHSIKCVNAEVSNNFKSFS